MFRHRFFGAYIKLELPFAYRCGDYCVGLVLVRALGVAGACVRA